MSSLLAAYTTSTYDLTLTSQSDNNTYGYSYSTGFASTRSKTYSKTTSYNVSVLLDSRNFSTDVTETLTTETVTSTYTETQGLHIYTVSTDIVESYNSFPGDTMDCITDTDTASALDVATEITLTFDVIPDGRSWGFDVRYSGTTSITSYTYSTYVRTDTYVTSSVSTEQAYSGPNEDQTIESAYVDETTSCMMSETSSLSTISYDTLSIIYTGVQWSDVSFTSKATTDWGTGSLYSVRTYTATKSTTSWSRTYEVNRVIENTYETSTTASTITGFTGTWRYRHFYSWTYYTEWGRDDAYQKTVTKTSTQWVQATDTSMSDRSKIYYPITEIIDVSTKESITDISIAVVEDSKQLDAVNVDTVVAELDEQETVSDFTNTTYHSISFPWLWDSYNTDIDYYTVKDSVTYEYGETNMTWYTTFTYYTSCNACVSYANGSSSETTSDKTETSFSETYTGWYSNTALSEETTYTERRLIVREDSWLYDTTHTTASVSDYSTQSISQSATGIKIEIEDNI